MAMTSITVQCCFGSGPPSCVSPFSRQLSALLTKYSTVRARPKRRVLSHRSCSEIGGHHSLDRVEDAREGTVGRGGLVERLLKRRWLLERPSTKISKVLLVNSPKVTRMERSELLGQAQFRLQGMTSNASDLGNENGGPLFYVIRDDLLHPLLGGNKLRKLDALIPLLEDCRATDVITCGGCQSAHTAALAFACAERGMKAHLLLRGEKPSVSTGYNLLSSMYGHSTYVPRSEYADRAAMFTKYATTIAGSSGSWMWLDGLGDSITVEPVSEKKVVVVKEGAGDAVALLGLIRLIQYLSRPTVFGRDNRLHIVVDTGTGTTAVGLALGILLLRLPWKVTGVILVDNVDRYEANKLRLISSFCEQYSLAPAEALLLPVSWKERWKPRKFGNVFPGEVQTCRSVAQQTGILLDPIYTLAGWEAATKLLLENDGEGHGYDVVMLHTGGSIGLFGLAQRYPKEF